MTSSVPPRGTGDAAKPTAPDPAAPGSGEVGGNDHSRRVLRGFAAMSASSFSVMIIQLGYAAVTSRLLEPSAFGAYAVGLSAVTVLGMFSGSAMGQAAARRGSESSVLDRSLLTLSVITGILVAAIIVVAAPGWGVLWGIPDSTWTTRVLAVGTPFAAVAAVLAGVLRRLGRTTVVASWTAVGQVVGIGVGLIVVATTRLPWSLGVASVTGWALTALLLALAVPRDRLKPIVPSSESIDDVLYSAKTAAMNGLRAATYQLPGWAIGRYVGASSLGAFNRAQTLITIPLQSLQRSFNYSLFPELRPSGPVFRSPRAFTDIMVLIVWAAVVLGSVGFFVAPPFITIVLGPGWEEAAQIAGLAVLLGVVPMVGVPLGSAIEALGWFKVASLAWVLGTGMVAIGVYVTFLNGSPIPAVLGILGSSLVTIIVSGVALSRAGLLWWRDLLFATWVILLAQALLSASLALMTSQMDGVVAELVVTAAVGLVELGVLWTLGARTPFGRRARAYRLPGFRP